MMRRRSFESADPLIMVSHEHGRRDNRQKDKETKIAYVPRSRRLSLIALLIVTTLCGIGIYRYFSNGSLIGLENLVGQTSGGRIPLGPFIESDDRFITSDFICEEFRDFKIYINESIPAEYHKYAYEAWMNKVHNISGPDVSLLDCRVYSSQFSTEYLIHRLLNNSCLRTRDPSQADLIFIPVYLSLYERMLWWGKAFSLIVDWENYDNEYYRRMSGRDHFYATTISRWNNLHRNRDIIMVSVESPPHYEITTPESAFTNITIPYYHCVSEAPTVKRDIFALYMAGEANDGGLRVSLVSSLRPHPQVFFHFLDHHPKSVDTSALAQMYRRSIFCFCPRGDTISAKRLFDAMQGGCIPVVIADGLMLPFDGYVDWSNTVVRIPEFLVYKGEVMHLLERISANRIDELQKGVEKAAKAVLFNFPISQGDAFHLLLKELYERAKLIRAEKVRMGILSPSPVIDDSTSVSNSNSNPMWRVPSHKNITLTKAQRAQRTLDRLRKGGGVLSPHSKPSQRH